ncbi:MAG TPA: alpha/beta fold hydrolase [Thermoanaerobaculia bacterium]|nr:alpha/beta fold hydrolase [Thermoanaerobaculia bacterium]
MNDPVRAAVDRPALATVAPALLLLAAFTALPLAVAQQPTLTLQLCDLPGLATPARCGTFLVPENRDTGEGRQVELAVVVLPSTGDTPARRAVTYLAGGPGESSTRGAAGFAGYLADLRDRFDLLLVDQRGTGQSRPLLRCPYQDDPARGQQYLDQFMSLGGLTECRRVLERQADLRPYTPARAADDLDDVRAALGYETLDLVGVSYGTRVALEYARRHPESTRTLTLLGPVAMDARMPLDMARDLDAMLAGLFAACARDEGCRSTFPALDADLGQALARLEQGVEPVLVPSPLGGEPLAVPMNRDVFAQALRYMLYAPASQVGLPYALHRAGLGDFGRVASFAAMSGAQFSSGADGLYLSVTCAEDVPFFTLEEGRAAAAGTLLGELRVNQQKAACALWPRGEIPPGFHDPVRTSVPALLVVGALDPATPPRWAQRIAAHMPTARVVVVPEAGHGTEGLAGGECVVGLPARFIAAGSFDGLDLDCAASARLAGWQLAPPPAAVELAPEALAELAGSYASAEGVTVAVAVKDGELTADGMGRTFVLVPVGGDRFLVAGAPGAVAFVVQRDDAGAVRRLVLEQGGVVALVFERLER